jgi:hypothetical protein
MLRSISFFARAKSKPSSVSAPPLISIPTTNDAIVSPKRKSTKTKLTQFFSESKPILVKCYFVYLYF